MLQIKNGDALICRYGMDEFQIEEAQKKNVIDWSDKKGANELSKKLKPNFIQTVLNFQIQTRSDPSA